MSPVDTSRAPLIEVRVIGPFDAEAVRRVGAILDDAVDLCPAHLVVDLESCGSLDGVAIGLLAGVRHRVRERGGRLTLRGLPVPVAQRRPPGQA